MIPIVSLKLNYESQTVESSFGLVSGIDIKNNKNEKHTVLYILTVIIGTLRSVVASVLLPAILVLSWTALFTSPLLIFTVSILSRRFESISGEVFGKSFQPQNYLFFSLLIILSLPLTVIALYSIPLFNLTVQLAMENIHLIVFIFPTLVFLRGCLSTYENIVRLQNENQKNQENCEIDEVKVSKTQSDEIQSKSEK